MACGSADEKTPWDSLTTTGGVGRSGLGQAAPAGAPGNELYLQRVVIEPGAKLATHFHDGTQVAHVEAGVLTYNIVSGEARITRASGAAEVVRGPAVAMLAAGDGVVETRDLIHFGSNDGDERVVITLAALLASGASLSTPAP